MRLVKKCSNCGVNIVPKQNGQCPACQQENITEPLKADEYSQSLWKTTGNISTSSNISTQSGCAKNKKFTENPLQDSQRANIMEGQSAKEVLSWYRREKNQILFFCLFFLIPGIYLVVAAYDLYSEGYQERQVVWSKKEQMLTRHYVPSTEDLKKEIELFSTLFSRDSGMPGYIDSLQENLQARCFHFLLLEQSSSFWFLFSCSVHFLLTKKIGKTVVGKITRSEKQRDGGQDKGLTGFSFLTKFGGK